MFHLHEQTPREFDYTRAAADGNWQDWQRAFRKRLSNLTGLTRIREQHRQLS